MLKTFSSRQCMFEPTVHHVGACTCIEPKQNNWNSLLVALHLQGFDSDSASEASAGAMLLKILFEC